LRLFGIALRLRALATLLLARERRRIASLKAQDYADFQTGITAGICDQRNGVSRISLQAGALGQNGTFSSDQSMSAMTPKADIR
jgi:hypothetical protein